MDTPAKSIKGVRLFFFFGGGGLKKIRSPRQILEDFCGDMVDV